MKRYQKGQALIEALVALGIIMVVLSAISTVVVNSLFNSQFIKEQNLASKYSQEGIEIVRGIQISNLTHFKNDLTDLSPGLYYCINASGSDLTTTSCDTTTANTPSTSPIYNRTVDLQRGSPDASPCNTTLETKVTVTTRWTSSKCGGTPFCHKTEVQSCIVHNTGITP